MSPSGNLSSHTTALSSLVRMALNSIIWAQVGISAHVAQAEAVSVAGVGGVTSVVFSCFQSLTGFGAVEARLKLGTLLAIRQECGLIKRVRYSGLRWISRSRPSWFEGLILKEGYYERHCEEI